MSELLRLFPLDLVLFPGAMLPLHIFEPRYKEMIGECLRLKEPFGLLRAVAGEERPRLSEFGCTAEIVDVLRTYPDGRMDILTVGRRRFELTETNDDRSFLRGKVQYFDDEANAVSVALDAMRSSVRGLHSELALLTDAEDLAADAQSDYLSFQLASLLPLDLDFKETLLEMRAEEERLRTLLDYYQKIVPKLKQLLSRRLRTDDKRYVN